MEAVGTGASRCAATETFAEKIWYTWPEYGAVTKSEYTPPDQPAAASAPRAPAPAGPSNVARNETLFARSFATNGERSGAYSCTSIGMYSSHVQFAAP